MQGTEFTEIHFAHGREGTEFTGTYGGVDLGSNRCSWGVHAVLEDSLRTVPSTLTLN